MSEYATVYQAAGAGLGLIIGSLFYSLGGRDGKWKRRFIASFLLATTLNILFLLRGIWFPWFLLIWPILIGGFSLGYGAEKLGSKLIKRAIVVVTVNSACVLCSVVLHNYWLLIPSIGIGAFSIFLGVSSKVEAAAEEFFICMILCLGLFLYPFMS